MIVLGPSLAVLRYVMYFRFMDRRYREFSIGRELRWAKEAMWGPRVPPLPEQWALGLSRTIVSL